MRGQGWGSPGQRGQGHLPGDCLFCLVLGEAIPFQAHPIVLVQPNPDLALHYDQRKLHAEFGGPSCYCFGVLEQTDKHSQTYDSL